MKRTSKTLLLVLCAVLLVTASVMGTMAYLTAEDTITNTFTVGSVKFDANGALDETDVDLYGVKDGDTRVKANQYKLIPGHTYVKDPTIHIAEGSEACYVFVQVDNGIKDIEAAGDTTIAKQMKNNGWELLSGNVYYKENAVDARNAKQDVVIFESFKLANNADVSGYAEAKIEITAYLVQADGFANAQAAWDATFGAPVTP